MQNSNSSSNRKSAFLARYGPWAVITGASSGIGNAIARRLAADGFNLVLVARSKDVLAQMVSDLSRQHNVEVRPLTLDLAAASSDSELEMACRDLDIGLLIASAGFGTSGSFLVAEREPELEMLAVNCRALLSASLHFGKRFAQRKRGGIVLLSSIVGFQGLPNAAHYAATKAYVQTLAEGLQVELAPHGVDVLAAAPGPTNTGFAARADMQMGNALNPDDIAQPILAALGRRVTVLPGFLSKLLTYSLVPLPRWARVQIMGKVMHGMTKHQKKASATI